METKGILRMVLRMVFLVILGVMTSGSSCDKNKGGGNPTGPVDPNLASSIEVWSTTHTYSFGGVPFGSSKTLQFGVMNDGAAPLTFQLQLYTTYFSLENVNCTGILPAPKEPYKSKGKGKTQEGSFCYFKVRYTPPCEEETHLALLGIESNDPNKPNLVIFLSGYPLPENCVEETTWPTWPEPDTGTGTGTRSGEPDTGTGTGTRSGGGTRSGQ